MYGSHAAVALFRGLFVHEGGMLSWYSCRVGPRPLFAAGSCSLVDEKTNIRINYKMAAECRATQGDAAFKVAF